ncbi:Piwi-like protein 2 [Orchesella cincta]|uniref:Piwi-like protein 2 n=1 Tax=Orchesella cincta TaxID=48709 RepID=A0A1D2MW56_ORCCI|nr:Piwi-like protein 2 [Orchesella cincta]
MSSTMSSVGRGRGRGRPPTSPIQEETPRSPPTGVERAEDVVVAPPVAPRREEVTMQDLVERYADPDQPEELAALRQMAISQVTSPASREASPPKDITSRGRFRGRGVSAVRTPAIDIGGGHGQPIAVAAAPSRPRSPILPLAPQLDVAGSSGSGVVGRLPDAPSTGSASDYYRTAIGSLSAISRAADPASVAAPASVATQPPVIAAAPVVQEEQDVETVAAPAQAKSPPVELPVISRVGTKGVRLDVATNYVRLKLSTGRPGIVEYHVSYSVPMESVAIRRKALKQFENRLGLVKSFDGMILFLPYILDDDVTVLHGIHPIDADVELTVHVTFVKVKPMKDAIPFFNILLRRIMIELGFVEIRREFYDLELAQFLKQHKLEIWPGFNPVAENQEDGLMINIDACSRVLRMDTVFDY